MRAFFATAITTEDDKWCRIADTVSAYFESMTGRYIVARAITERQGGTGGRRMFLNYTPVASFGSVVILRYPSDTTTETMDPLRYNVDLETGCVWAHNDIFQFGNANVAFTYTPGYGAQDSDNIPRDLWGCGLDLVRALYDQERTGATGGTQISIGNQTYIIKPDLAFHVKRVIEAYTLRQI